MYDWLCMKCVNMQFICMQMQWRSREKRTVCGRHAEWRERVITIITRNKHNMHKEKCSELTDLSIFTICIIYA